MYTEDQMLMLSGIQHYMFCPRQWALIHLEEEWSENKLTTEGEILHKRVDDPFENTFEKGKVIYRAHRIASYNLGLSGIADIIEWEQSEESNGIRLPKRQGFWLPHPVEYKHGIHKQNSCDEMQLVAQVICLEEMYNITIQFATLFYAQTRQREIIKITDELRIKVQCMADEMHQAYERCELPHADNKASCKRCSLFDACMPQNHKDVRLYLKQLFDA